MQLVQLRFRAVCAVCSSKLPPRAEAWQDDESQRTVCLTCQRIEDQAATAAAAAEAARNRTPVPDLNRAPRLVPARPGELGAEPVEGLGDPADAGLDGAFDFALAEQERISQERAEAERRAAEQVARDAGDAATQEPMRSKGSISLPGFKRTGGTGDRFVSEPLSAIPPLDDEVTERPTRLPQVGPSLAAQIDVDRSANGRGSDDNAIFRALEAARPHGLEIIRSRPWVGTRVETEAIVVGPSGVWIVDGLGTAAAPVEKGFLAGHAGSELLNVVGGRTSIISGLLFDSPYQWVPVRGSLCFDSTVPPWFDAPFTLAGITITTPRHLVDSLFMPLHLDADTRNKVAQHLVNRF